MTELRNQLTNIVEDHQACLVLAKSVGSLEVYEGTTATPEDLVKGKTAYSNGERIVGTLESFGDNNAMVNTIIPEGTAQKSGVLQAIKKVTGVSSGASGKYLFNNCSALEELEFDAKNITGQMTLFCGNCTSLKNITLKNTGKATDFSSAFSGCSSLETAPDIDTTSVTRFYMMYANCTNLKHFKAFHFNTTGDGTGYVNQRMFENCPNLTDESLNNILLMCANSPLMPNKQFSNLGLSSTQIEKCKTLSNYQSAVATGWKA